MNQQRSKRADWSPLKRTLTNRGSGSKVDAILQHSTILSGSVKAASVGSVAAGSFARGTLAPYKSAQAHPVMRQPEAVFFSVTVSMAFSDIGLPFSIQLRRADCTT